MKKNFKYLMLALVAVMGFSLTSCKDDDVTLSRKVLASVDVLEYEGLAPDVQIITVVSDGEWVVEAPEWISVTPASGVAGQTEVEIALKDNLRDGSLDNPRRANVIFRGRSLDANATVLVRQDGDKWRDPVDFTIDDLEAAEEETVVKLPNMVVTAVTGNGFILSDGTKFAYITEATTPVSIGDKVSVMGEKFTDTMKMAYVKEYSTTIEGTASLPSLTPFDISSTLDSTNGTTYQYVTLTGNYDGSSITVGDNSTKVYFVDANPSLGINKLTGHKLQVTGYFAGLAAPVLNIIPTEIDDLGVNEILYFYDDFSWMEPWVAIGNGSSRCADQVGAGNNGGTCPQLQSVNNDGLSAYDALLDRGYEFVCIVNSTVSGYQTKTAKECTYLQDTYLKFSKTSYHAGLVLPEMPDADPSDKLEMSFDWCPMVTGSGNFDKTELVVILKDGTTEKQFAVPAHTLVNKGEMKWQHAVISITGVTPTTRVIIRNIDSQWPMDDGNSDPTLVRYFLDNIKIKVAD